jgi:hypothetical protein
MRTAGRTGDEVEAQRMTSKNISAITVCLLLACGLIVYGRHLKQMHAEARSQLLQVRQSLVDANTKSDVDRLFVPLRYPLLGLHKISQTEWIVTTPSEFGASNWYLYLEFRGTTLSEMRVRLEDSERIRPELAPPDIRK